MGINLSNIGSSSQSATVLHTPQHNSHSSHSLTSHSSPSVIDSSPIASAIYTAPGIQIHSLSQPHDTATSTVPLGHNQPLPLSLSSSGATVMLGQAAASHSGVVSRHTPHLLQHATSHHHHHD